MLHIQIQHFSILKQQIVVFHLFLMSYVAAWCSFQKSEVPADYDKHDPEQKQIYRFVRTLFSAAQLTAECAIVTLVSISVIVFKCVCVCVCVCALQC